MRDVSKLNFISFSKKYLKKKSISKKIFRISPKNNFSLMNFIYGSEKIKNYGSKLYFKKNSHNFSLYFINSNKLFGKSENKEINFVNKRIFGYQKNIQLRDTFNINTSQLKIEKDLLKVKSNFRTKVNDISLLDEETRTRIDNSIRNQILKIQNTKNKKPERGINPKTVDQNFLKSEKNNNRKIIVIINRIFELLDKKFN